MRIRCGEESSTVLPGPITTSIWGIKRSDVALAPCGSVRSQSPRRIGICSVTGLQRSCITGRMAHESLRIGDLADTTIFGKRITDDKQIFVYRFVSGDNRQLADRLGPLAADPQAFHRLQQLRFGIDHGFKAKLVTLRRAFPSIDINCAAIASLTFRRPNRKQFSPFVADLVRGKIQQG